jgi:Na+-transporting methylmalonyl-CoA/oxaloacetate decarboxylase beta subunit
MNTTTFFRKRNVVLFVTSSILIVAVLVSVIGRPTNMTGTTIGNNSNQNYIMMYTYGPNITGSVPVGPTITKSIAYQFI